MNAKRPDEDPYLALLDLGVALAGDAALRGRFDAAAAKRAAGTPDEDEERALLPLLDDLIEGSL